jgi:hypothetical protein
MAHINQQSGTGNTHHASSFVILLSPINLLGESKGAHPRSGASSETESLLDKGEKAL